MTPADAKKIIAEHFKVKTFTDDAGDNISESEFDDVFSAVYHLIPFPDEKQNASLILFLWAGCRKFDRWFAPSPYVVPPEFEARLSKFSSALLRADNNSPTNVAVFQVHCIRNEVYHEFSNVPLPLTNSEKIQDLRDRLHSIQGPCHPGKLPEFEAEKSTVLELLRAIEVGDLKTECNVTLPYPVARGPLRFTAKSDGVLVEVKLRPQFAMPPQLMTQGAAPTVLMPRVSTRWQFGTATLEFKFSGLIDHSTKTEPLQLPMEMLPVDGWPNIFRVVFNLIYEAFWALRSQSAFIGIWVPSPADLGDIEWWIHTARDQRMNYIRKGNPALGMIGFNPSLNEEKIGLGSLPRSSWTSKCRVLAEQYLTLGETREAMFWINVGAESLLDERMLEFGKRANPPLDILQITGAPSYWEQARSLVEQQFPEALGRITWPDSVPHVSMFRRITYFARHVQLQGTAREISAAYSKIQRRRNSLFHGEDEAPIDARDAKKAIEAFDRLFENFVEEQARHPRN